MTKILVVGPAWVGDMVMAHSLFQILRSYHTNVTIHVLAPKWSHGVLKCMPEVTELIEMPLRHRQLGVLLRWKIARQLRKQQFDQAIILPNSLKSSLIPAMAKIAVRTGYLGEKRHGLLNDIRGLDKTSLPMQVQQFANLGLPRGETLTEFPRPQLVVDESRKQALLTKLCLYLDKPVLILCPGSQYGSSKRWPAQYFAEVAEAEINKGRQVWLLGSDADRSIGEEINRLSHGRCRNLCGVTALDESVDLMSCATAVVTNDSGLMHVAAALNRNVIALFGSSSEEKTPPLSDNSQILKLELDCRPCFQRQCPYQHLDCLMKLYPKKVIELLQ